MPSRSDNCNWGSNDNNHRPWDVVLCFSYFDNFDLRVLMSRTFVTVSRTSAIAMSASATLMLAQPILAFMSACLNGLSAMGDPVWYTLVPAALGVVWLSTAAFAIEITHRMAALLATFCIGAGCISNYLDLAALRCAVLAGHHSTPSWSAIIISTVIGNIAKFGFPAFTFWACCQQPHASPGPRIVRLTIRLLLVAGIVQLCYYHSGMYYTTLCSSSVVGAWFLRARSVLAVG